MTPVPIFPLRLDWPSAIGCFILQFAFLEQQLFGFVSDCILGKNIKNMGAKDCVEEIGRHLKKNHAPQRSQFISWTDRFEPIRLLRNHIAHGHFHLSMKNGQWQLTLVMSKDADLTHHDSPVAPKRVEHAEIVNALKTLAKLIEEFKSFGEQNWVTDNDSNNPESLPRS